MHNHDRQGGIKFTFTEIYVDQVVDELKAISNSKVSDLDGIGIKLIKYGTEAILCKIFKICLKQGSIPDELKVAGLTPIYKSGKKYEFSNYRPISVLPICSKFIAKIVYKQLYKYVTDNKLMCRPDWISLTTFNLHCTY